MIRDIDFISKKSRLVRRSIKGFIKKTQYMNEDVFDGNASKFNHYGINIHNDNGINDGNRSYRKL